MPCIGRLPLRKGLTMIGQIVSLESTAYTEWILYFFMYSVLGWLVSGVYALIRDRRWRNVGFLRGPWMPGYGLGAILGLLLSQWIPLHSFWRPLALFLMFAVIFGSLNFGYTALLRQLLPGRPFEKDTFRKYALFGTAYALLAMGMLYVLQPIAQRAVHSLSNENARALSWLAQLLFLADFVFSGRAIQHLQQKRDAFRAADDAGTPIDPVEWLSTLNGYERHYIAQYPLDREVTWAALFPLARQYKRKKRYQSIRQRFLQFLYWLLETPRTDATEAQSNPKSFAYGFKPYKLFWVFAIGGVIGFVLETIFCVLKNGHLESRQGLLYGPFSQIYGFGAILMLLPLYPLRKKNNLLIFLASGGIGGAFEALASLIQEYVFGSVSWQYDQYSLPILGGRTSVVYMLMWGALGVFLIRVLYPKLSRWIERIPNRQGVALTWVLLFLLLVDGLLSGLAVHRWNERLENPTPARSLDRLLDEAYPNDFMEKVYPNMVHKTASGGKLS